TKRASSLVLPFDLHVLGLPPAFTLSQDQTLHLSIAARPEGSAYALSAVSSQPKLLDHSHLAMRCLIHLDCVEHLPMDNHPPARRPHKSPAHTVKDLRNRPQRRVPTRSPKCPSEPHILQQISWPSTPSRPLFSSRCP